MELHDLTEGRFVSSGSYFVHVPKAYLKIVNESDSLSTRLKSLTQGIPANFVHRADLENYTFLFPKKQSSHACFLL